MLLNEAICWVVLVLVESDRMMPYIQIKLSHRVVHRFLGTMTVQNRDMLCFW